MDFILCALNMLMSLLIHSSHARPAARFWRRTRPCPKMKPILEAVKLASGDLLRMGMNICATCTTPMEGFECACMTQHVATQSLWCISHDCAKSQGLPRWIAAYLRYTRLPLRAGVIAPREYMDAASQESSTPSMLLCDLN